MFYRVVVPLGGYSTGDWGEAKTLWEHVTGVQRHPKE